MDINKDGTVISNEGIGGKKEKSGKKKRKEEEYEDAALQKKRKRKEERKDERELETRKKNKEDVAEDKTDMGVIEGNDQEKNKKEDKKNKSGKKKHKEEEYKDAALQKKRKRKEEKKDMRELEMRNEKKENVEEEKTDFIDEKDEMGVIEANDQEKNNKEDKKNKSEKKKHKEEEYKDAALQKKRKRKEEKKDMRELEMRNEKNENVEEEKTDLVDDKDEMGVTEANDREKNKKEKKEKKKKKKENETKDDKIVADEQKKIAKDNMKKMARDGEVSLPNLVDGGKANCKNQTEKAKKKKKGNVVHNKEEDNRDEKGKKDDKEKNTSVKPKSKKVTFSDELEVFPPTDDGATSSTKEEGDGYLRGKRFTPEEDKIVMQAVYDYIDKHNLGEEGLEMVLSCIKHKKIRNCWKEISMALPNRPRGSIYLRAHTLFERDDSRHWSQEEVDQVRQFHAKHGPKWSVLAKEMGKFRHHVKEVWRRIRLPNKNSGNWSQDEYQTLFELVNKDLQMKVLEEKKKRHCMLRDNIGWEAISTSMGTRATAPCCKKWYYQLTSPMVAQGIWDDADDYRLLMKLVDVDASCEDEVDWENLLEHRSGDVCRERWNQMWNHLGQHGNKTWAEQVDILSKRYCPDMLEVREEVTKQREW